MIAKFHLQRYNNRMLEKLKNKFGVHNKAELKAFVWQILKFCLVGVSNAAISWGVFYILNALWGFYYLAYALGFIISVINAYFWSSRYVFKVKEGESRSFIQSLIKVFASYGFTFFFGFLLMYIWRLIGIPEQLTPIINALINIPINFVLNKFWALKSK